MARKQTPTKPAPIKWYNQRPAAALLWIAAWAATVYFALRALDTARNWHYLAVFVLFIFGLNRLVAAIGKRHA